MSREQNTIENEMHEFFENEFLLSEVFLTQDCERTTTRKEHIERQNTVFFLIKNLNLRPAVQDNTYKINALINILEKLV